MMWLRSFAVFVFLDLLLGAIDVPFNQDSYKPYQWDWEAQTKDFANVPTVQCPARALRMCICKNDLRRFMYLVDCGGGNINSSHFTELPRNTTHFRASWNGLKTLPNGIFDELTCLLHLDLSDNDLETIENDAFAGLTSLVALDLSNNSYLTPGEFLRLLSSLRILNLHKNFGYLLDDVYCNRSVATSISDLGRLEKLQFSRLRMDDYCLYFLQSTSVTYLSITEVALIDLMVFSNWTTLNSLQLSLWPVTGIFNVFLSFSRSSILHVERLYIEGELLREQYFSLFNAPNLTALGIHNTLYSLY